MCLTVVRPVVLLLREQCVVDIHVIKISFSPALKTVVEMKRIPLG